MKKIDFMQPIQQISTPQPHLKKGYSPHKGILNPNNPPRITPSPTTDNSKPK